MPTKSQSLGKEQILSALVEARQTILPEVLNKDFGIRFRGYKVTIQRLLEAELEDERVHYQQIVDFFKESK